MTMSDSNRHNFSEEAIKVYDVEGELFLVGQKQVDFDRLEFQAAKLNFCDAPIKASSGFYLGPG